MNIEKMIEKWEEKHSSLLNEYSKGNANNEVMQMYRNQMKNVLDFINDLKQVKNLSSKPVLADSKPRHCPECNSKNVIMFDSDNDLCNDCGAYFC